MDKDEVFGKEMEVIPDFTFSNGVAAVFDDMLDRSVPFYQEMQRMISEMAADFAVEGSNVYDLGCSTGTTLVNLHQSIPAGVKLIGIDNSEPMLEKCRLKLESIGQARDFELLCTDLNQGIHIDNASLVCMVLTLQFIRPLYRNKLIESIFRGMNENGCLILVEKVTSEDTLLNRHYIKYYYEMKKKKGYSNLEISQKREALENVLIPYRLMENREMLLETGFRYVDVFFKWYNFCGMVAIK
ncbi:MAG TPA: carboxy-S-adenosyl-L-methionine synthase CmoA [Geobacteraceae bacterium]